LTNATSEEIFTALKSIDYVGTDNYVRADPRADISWMDAIQSFKVLRDCDEAVGMENNKPLICMESTMNITNGGNKVPCLKGRGAINGYKFWVTTSKFCLVSF